mgnify:CR=1 FL=1
MAKGWKFSPEQLKRLSDAHKGYIHTEEQKRKISESVKESWEGNEGRKNMLIERMIKRHKEEKEKGILNPFQKYVIEHPEHQVEAGKKAGRATINKYGRQHMRHAYEALTLEMRRENTIKMLLSSERKETKIELILENVVKNLGLEYRKQHPHKFTIIDIAIPQYKIAIYADGCYWHGCPLHCPNSKIAIEGKVRDKDTRVNKKLQDEGWYVIRLWEHDLLDEKYASNLLASILNLSVVNMDKLVGYPQKKGL